MTGSQFDLLAEADIENPLTVIELLDQFRLPEVRPESGVVIRECFGNSVRCALELALLDAAFQVSGQPLGELVRMLPESHDLYEPRWQVRYSGAITSESPFRRKVSTIKMKLFGFQQVKVKVAAGGNDAELLQSIRRWLGPRVDLRLDANEAWRCDKVVSRMRPLRFAAPSSLEQPVPGLVSARHEASFIPCGTLLLLHDSE